MFFFVNRFFIVVHLSNVVPLHYIEFVNFPFYPHLTVRDLLPPSIPVSPRIGPFLMLFIGLATLHDHADLLQGGGGFPPTAEWPQNHMVLSRVK